MSISFWIIASIIILGIVAIFVLMIYANHAGKNAARVKVSEQEAESARQASELEHRMSEAEANKPATKHDLLERLKKGDLR